jgi:hypothetical protein
VSLTLQESVPEWLPLTLRQVEGLDAHARPDRHSVSVMVNGGRATNFEVFSIPVLSQERAKELIDKWRTSDPNSTGRDRLIATRHLSSATRGLLRENGVSWVEEGTGICRLFAPGLLVDVRIEGAVQKESILRARLRDRSGVVAEILLLNFLHQDIRLANVAKQANVSTGLVSRVLTRLAKLKLLDTQGAGPQRYWKMSNAGALLDLWATEEQAGAQSTGLYVWSRSPQELLKKMPRLNELNGRWAVAGTAAANLYAPTLTTFPDPSVWIESRISIRQVAGALGGEIVDKGANLQLLQSKKNLAFANASVWTPANASAEFGVQDLRIISRPRAYIETINGSGRAPEVAQNLRQRIVSNGIS